MLFRNLLLAAACALAVPHIEARPPTEYEVKAAFLFNFAKFVDWPPNAFKDAAAAVVIGIVGEDPFGETLPALVRDQTAKGRPIEIRRFKPDNDFTGCHLLFISRSAVSAASEILERVKGLPILIIGEQENFLRLGGMICFVIVQESVRFDISLVALEKAGLTASSKLLNVARSVKKV